MIIVNNSVMNLNVFKRSRKKNIDRLMKKKYENIIYSVYINKSVRRQK